MVILVVAIPDTIPYHATIERLSRALSTHAGYDRANLEALCAVAKNMTGWLDF